MYHLRNFCILSCLPKSDLQDIYYPLSSWINIEGENTKIENILRLLKYLKGRLKLISHRKEYVMYSVLLLLHRRDHRLPLINSQLHFQAFGKVQHERNVYYKLIISY